MQIFLILFVLVLIASCITQLVRVLELINSINKKKESKITDKDNSNQSNLWIIFGVSFMVLTALSFYYWGDLTLPKPASKHGEYVDFLFSLTMMPIFIVFFVSHIILLYILFKYKSKEGIKARFFSHNHKLEIFWASFITLFLSILISTGLYYWTKITNMNYAKIEDPIIIEVYGKQFNWTARYAGKDNKLGEANVMYVGDGNLVGINPQDTKGYDDIIVNEIHLPVNKKVIFKFRAQDVIHSAYMPHFRAQMNCVPGITTSFSFVPTVLTTDMRKDPKVIRNLDRINKSRKEKDLEEWEFDYILLCNKICGSAHYNMQIRIVVETKEEFDKWISQKETFKKDYKQTEVFKTLSN